VRKYIGVVPRTHHLQAQSPPPSECNPISDLESCHLRKAALGLDDLRTLATHFPYTSRIVYTRPISPCPSSTSQESAHYHTTHTSLKFQRRYIVAQRSNLIVEGLSKYVPTPSSTSGDADEDKSRSAHFLLMLKTYSVVCAVYGALHLLAWSFVFPTPIEAWLWRGSGLVMAGAPAVTLLSVVAWHIAGTNREYVRAKARSWIVRVGCRVVRGVCGGVGSVGIMMVLGLWVAYPFARVYVLVEGFVSLRSCEEGVYAKVGWAEFVPHVG
jgi:hypothetical protein